MHVFVHFHFLFPLIPILNPRKGLLITFPKGGGRDVPVAEEILLVVIRLTLPGLFLVPRLDHAEIPNS